MKITKSLLRTIIKEEFLKERGKYGMEAQGATMGALAAKAALQIPDNFYKYLKILIKDQGAEKVKNIVDKFAAEEGK